MQASLITGNIFSLLAAVCPVISIPQKSKKSLILWQLWSIILSTFSCVALLAYAAAVTCVMDLLRNVLAYKDKLSDKITGLLVILSVIFGLWINNLGIIGILAVTASASYTVFMYITKNEQQMRWAFVLNQVLWIIHDAYIKAYPATATAAVLTFWTLMQIYKNRRK